MRKPVFLSLAILLVAALLLFPACKPSESAVPEGPAKVKSFTVKQETLQVGECPTYEFEVENAAAITLKEDDKVIFHIESASAGSEEAYRKPLGNVAYAATLNPTEHPATYPAGVYPVEFKGASVGEPAKAVWEFGDTTGDNGEVGGPRDPTDMRPLVSIEVVSPSGEVTTTELPPEECPEVTACPPVITSCSVYPDPCPSNVAPEIRWSGWWVERVEIWQEGEMVAEDTSPTLSPMSMPTGFLGVYPVGFKGAASGEPAKAVWKFGEGEDTMCFEVKAFSQAGSSTSQCCVAISETEDGNTPNIVRFTGESPVAPGASSLVEWSTTGADTCVLLRSDTGQRAVVSSQGSMNVQVTRDTTLTLTCANPYGCSSQKGTIRVQEQAASQQGWCCLKGVVSSCTKTECDQTAGCQFFTTEAEAQSQCRAAP